MKALGAAAIVVLAAGPAVACPLSSALFVCAAGEAMDGALVLCGADDELAVGDLITFTDDSVGGSGAVVAPRPAESFAFAHWWTDGGHFRMEASWTDEGKSYRLHSEQGEMFSAAGLSVRGEGGAETLVQCAETPTVYLGFMQENFACDSNTLFGAAACEEKPAGRPPG